MIFQQSQDLCRFAEERENVHSSVMSMFCLGGQNSWRHFSITKRNWYLKVGCETCERKHFCFSSQATTRQFYVLVTLFPLLLNPPDDVTTKSFRFSILPDAFKAIAKVFPRKLKSERKAPWSGVTEGFMRELSTQWTPRQHSPFSIVSLALEMIFVLRFRKLLKSRWVPEPVVASSSTT